MGNYVYQTTIELPAHANELKILIEKIQKSILSQEFCEEGYLLLGETKAGKTTLAYFFSNKDLKSVEKNGELVIELKDETSSIQDMIISAQKRSETKIPHAIISQSGIFIWDCPGFLDTGNEEKYQDIINAVSIKTLFKKLKLVKFLLLVPQKDLKGVAGDFLRAVRSFCELFENIVNLEEVSQSVCLIITQCKIQTKIENIIKDIEQIFADNKRLDEKTNKMIGYLLKNIEIFYAPQKEGEYLKEKIKLNDKEENSILASIHNKTKFFNTNKREMNIALSSESKILIGQLFQKENEVFCAILNDIYLKMISRCEINPKDFIVSAILSPCLKPLTTHYKELLHIKTLEIFQSFHEFLNKFNKVLDEKFFTEIRARLNLLRSAFSQYKDFKENERALDFIENFAISAKNIQFFQIELGKFIKFENNYTISQIRYAFKKNIKNLILPQEDQEFSIYYFKEVIKYFEKDNLPKLEIAYRGLGKAYLKICRDLKAQNMPSYEEAISYLIESVKTKQMDLNLISVELWSIVTLFDKTLSIMKEKNFNLKTELISNFVKYFLEIMKNFSNEFESQIKLKFKEQLTNKDPFELMEKLLIIYQNRKKINKFKEDKSLKEDKYSVFFQEFEEISRSLNFKIENSNLIRVLPKTMCEIMNLFSFPEDLFMDILVSFWKNLSVITKDFYCTNVSELKSRPGDLGYCLNLIKFSALYKKKKNKTWKEKSRNNIANSYYEIGMIYFLERKSQSFDNFIISIETREDDEASFPAYRKIDQIFFLKIANFEISNKKILKNLLNFNINELKDLIFERVTNILRTNYYDNQKIVKETQSNIIIEYLESLIEIYQYFNEINSYSSFKSNIEGILQIFKKNLLKPTRKNNKSNYKLRSYDEVLKKKSNKALFSYCEYIEILSKKSGNFDNNALELIFKENIPKKDILEHVKLFRLNQEYNKEVDFLEKIIDIFEKFFKFSSEFDYIYFISNAFYNWALLCFEQNVDVKLKLFLKAYEKDDLFYNACKNSLNLDFYHSHSLKKEISEKIAFIYYDSKEFLTALKYFREIEHRELIEKCFLLLIEDNPKDSKLFEDIGDYFYNEGENETALSYYKRSKYLKIPSERSLIETKITKIVKKVETLENKFLTFKSILSNFEEKASSVEDDLLNVKKRMTNVESDIFTANSRMSNVEFGVSFFKMEFSRVEKNVLDLKENVSSVVNRVINVENEIGEIKNKLLNVEKENGLNKNNNYHGRNENNIEANIPRDMDIDKKWKLNFLITLICFFTVLYIFTRVEKFG